MGPSMKCSERIPRVPPTHPVDNAAMLRKCPDCENVQDDGLPKFRTSMLMLQKVGKVERKLGVVLSIYSTNFDLYAVVSQDRNIVVKDCGYIKLKNCSVTTDSKSLILEIVQKNYEGVPLRFKVYKREHLDAITQLLHLNSEDDIFDSNIPLSSSPSGSLIHPGLKKIIRSNSPTTRSPRVSPNAKRKLSMPVLAEDEEREELEEQGRRLKEEDEDCESEE